MTKPRYLRGCAAGSQVGDLASAPAGYAWNVNLDDGNSNRNHQDNRNHALAVRVGECQGLVTFAALRAAYHAARRGKKPSWDQLEFDATWLEQLLSLQDRLNAGIWYPGAPTCFIVDDPKHRQIHAPPFADRVVHHWVVPQLEAIYEPAFIHDSYSNRRGKGTHAAVKRLQAFVHQVHSGQGGGWYLQLDVKNFFNSIHRPTLYLMLKRQMERADLGEPARRAVHALLTYPISRTGVRWACTMAERESVPAHKRLENAAPSCGIAIGNLSSQFFANVYLNELDQFVKHHLKAHRYLRYVDDFVLVHESRAQLLAWRDEIVPFLRDRLRLELKAEQRLQPLRDGIDFLGYVVFPTHTLVRRRVVLHAREKLDAWKRCHIRRGRVTANPDEIQKLRSICASYAGHFSHANSWRLRAHFRERYLWLRAVLRKKH